ncbi:hypothetical protein MPSEU_000299500 [Mayamaea pseudoterrestris]|nr:hypothetical protein MPSEU_000299500 [Mayamaea pseudoterrestris]
MLSIVICALWVTLNQSVKALQLDDSHLQQLQSRRTWMIGTATTAMSPALVMPLPALAAESSIPPIVKPGSRARLDPVTIGAWETMPQLQTTLGQARIGSADLRPFSQGLNPFADQELYYNPFLFGAWNTTATLKRKIFPFGTSYLPSSSLVEGSPRHGEEAVGNACTYEQHYFSTLANTLRNQVTVNFGTGVPQSKVIQDRSFNIISMSKAYHQLTPVEQVEWDYQKEPTKLYLIYRAAPVANDMRPLGRRRATVYLNGRARADNDQGSVSCVLEQSRSVLQAPGAVVVSDTEVVTEYYAIDSDHVKAVSRIAVYLSPNPNSREGLLWEQVGGRAVGLYDYELDMRRIKESFQLGDGTMIEKACVTTPKDYVQCE